MENKELIYRQAEEKDYPAIENMIREAFWNRTQPGCREHYIVHLMHERQTAVRSLEYVCELDGEIVGHVIYTPAYIPDAKLGKMLGLGPVSVKAELRDSDLDIGGELVRRSLTKACDYRYSAVFTIRNPDFYKRFGFVEASIFGIYFWTDRQEDPHFLVKELRRDVVAGYSGQVMIDDAFFPDPNEVEEFDKQFPPKEKKAPEVQ